MDVRCKYCQVEYEIADSRLAEGAQTIPCVNCGLPFEVKPPVGTTAPRKAPASKAPKPPSPGARKFRRARTSSLGSGPGPARRWLVRSPEGELREVPELTMLQKWIFTGLVTREWDISVDGSTWKPLGNIDELAPFFGFAEEAYDAWASSAGELVMPADAAGQKEDSAVELDVSQLEEVVDAPPPRPARPKPPRPRTQQGLPPPVPPHDAADDGVGDWLLVDDEAVFEVLHPEFSVTPVDAAVAAASGDEVVILDKPRPPTADPAPATVVELPAPLDLPEPDANARPIEREPSGKTRVPTVVPLPPALPEKRLPATPPGATSAAASSPAARRSAKESTPIPLADLDSPQPVRPVDTDDWNVGERPKPLARPEAPARRGGGMVWLAFLVAAGAGVYWFALRDRGTSEVASAQGIDAAPVVAITAPPDAAPAIAVAEPPDAAPVVTAEPEPRAPAPKKPTPKVEPDPPAKTGSDQSFAALVRKAEELAEAEDCKAAIPVYEKAIKQNTRSATAMTGLGYCYLDGGRYASAHTEFKRALAVAPAHIDALLGVAEAYTQQGLKPEAIEAYRKVLSARPTGHHAKIARRQIQRLGGDP